MLFVYGRQGQTHPIVSLYLFGDAAPAVAERDKAAWKTWMDEHFPAPAEANAGT